MPVPPHHFDDDPEDDRPGGLLDELERRQDDVLGRLDDLDARLAEVLKGLEPTEMDRPTADSEQRAASLSTESDVEDEFAKEEFAEEDLSDDDFGPADDWA